MEHGNAEAGRLLGMKASTVSNLCHQVYPEFFQQLLVAKEGATRAMAIKVRDDALAAVGAGVLEGGAAGLEGDVLVRALRTVHQIAYELQPGLMKPDPNARGRQAPPPERKALELPQSAAEQEERTQGLLARLRAR